MNDYLKQEGQKIGNRLVDIRRDIHRHPELGMEEFRTAKVVADTLKSLGLEVTEKIANTGVVGVLEGKNPGKTIAIRADMDALAVEEENDVPYRSTYPGKMHACGHDGHVAILLGAAMILSSMKDSLAGRVKFVFQPAEEKGPDGGAKFMIEEGVLQNPDVDAMIGFHIFPQVPAGNYIVRYGKMMAASDKFKIIINGKGGHPGLPHQTVDAVAVSGYVITALQTIVSRNTDPLDPSVVTLGKITGGTKHNIIAASAEIEGTARSFSNESRNFVEEKIKAIVSSVCEGLGARGEVHYENGYPQLENNNDIVRLLETSLTDMAGSDAVIQMEKPVMGSEDFAYFSHRVPSGYFIIGGKGEDEQFYPNHHPQFNFDECILEQGAVVLSKIAYDYLNQAASGSNQG